jgi:hypothetical protein
MSYRGALEIEIQARILERSHRLRYLHQPSRPTHQTTSCALSALHRLASALRGLGVRLAPGARSKPATIV